MKRTLLLILVLLVPALNSVPARASTQVSGPITSDTIWTVANSPYNLTGDVTVQDGATLTIEPGVRVSGSGRLIVFASSSANLRAQGSSSNPILFGRPESFGGIIFTSDSFMVAADSVIDHVEISHAEVGLDLQGVSLPISNSLFSATGRAISFNVGSLSITNSTFTNNQAEAIRGMARGQITITGSAFWNNGVSVAILGARTCSCNTARWDIHDNDMLRGPQSGQFDLTVSGNTAATSDIYDAADNWWEKSTEIEGRIYDGLDDDLEKVVSWNPPSTSPTTAFIEPASRKLSLSLKRHLISKGTLSSGHPECRLGVVKLQRNGGNGWLTLKQVATASDGSYQRRLSDRAGRYRAKISGSGDCLSALSPVRRHSH